MKKGKFITDWYVKNFREKLPLLQGALITSRKVSLNAHSDLRFAYQLVEILIF